MGVRFVQHQLVTDPVVRSMMEMSAIAYGHMVLKEPEDEPFHACRVKLAEMMVLSAHPDKADVLAAFAQELAWTPGAITPTMVQSGRFDAQSVPDEVLDGVAQRMWTQMAVSLFPDDVVVPPDPADDHETSGTDEEEPVDLDGDKED